MSFKTKMVGMISIFAIIMMLAACGNTENNSSENDKTQKEITLTDAIGKVTVPASPKRILAPYLEDSLVALDITPAAQWSIGATVLDYLQPKLKNVKRINWDMPLEQTLNANPDLIIFSSQSAIQNGQYDEYKKIAPTYVFKNEDSADWKKQLKVMGKIVGKEKLATDKLAQYEKKSSQISAKIKKVIGNESAAIIWITGDQYFLFENTRFAGNVLYQDLGVSQPKMIQQLPEAKATWQPVSLESLSNLDADHLFLLSKPGETGLTKLQQSNIYKGIPAVTKGNIYLMKDPSNWTINGLIANEKTIDEIEQSLTK